MKHRKLIILLLSVWVCMGAATVWADGIKERMKKRLPVISSLKAQGIVGETNQGYLGFVTAKQDGANVIAAENKDRKIIYTHIAKQQGVSVELVQKRRARVLSDRAKPGFYIQNDAGVWVKK